MKNGDNHIININSNTKLYCIFGNPVKRSLSPIIQNAAFINSGINSIYLAFEVDNIKDAISAMKNINICGASVTIPFKKDAINYIDDIDPLAKLIGSLNTLKNIDGKIIGYNTDGYGALSSLIENGIKVKGSNILIIGNGGSARAIAFTLMNEGAKVSIAGRNIDRILPLIKDLKAQSKNVDYILIKEITDKFAEEIDVIINTTPVGMAPDIDSIPVDENLIINKHTIFDIIYSPHSTKLIKIGESRGCKIIHGIEMLIYQGAKQFEIWTGLQAPFNVMKTSINKYI